MRRDFCITTIAALALWTAGCTTSPEGPEGQLLLGKAAVFSTQATVVATDYATRELTLEVPNKPGDNFFDVYIGEDFGDLSRVRLGDRLTVSYVQAVFVDLFQSGEVDPGIGFAEAIGKAPPHRLPARGVAEGVFVVADVKGVDRINQLVDLRGPKGIDKVFKVRNPAILDSIQVGDKVKTTFSRALIVDITRNPAG